MAGVIVFAAGTQVDAVVEHHLLNLIGRLIGGSQHHHGENPVDDGSRKGGAAHIGVSASICSCPDPFAWSNDIDQISVGGPADYVVALVCSSDDDDIRMVVAVDSISTVARGPTEKRFFPAKMSSCRSHTIAVDAAVANADAVGAIIGCLASAIGEVA